MFRAHIPAINKPILAPFNTSATQDVEGGR